MAFWLLSEAGISPNTQKSEYGYGDGVFLYSAIITNRDFEMAQILINKGANLDGTDVFGGTSLRASVSANDLEVTKFLLERGANPSYPGTAHEPLYISLITNSNFEMAELLYQYGADVNGQDSHGRPILSNAIEKNIITTKWLLDRGANPDQNGYLIDQQEVFSNDNPDVTEWLLKNGAGIGCFANPMYIALQHKAHDSAALLLAYRCPNTQDFDAVEWCGHTIEDILNYLGENDFTKDENA